MGRGFITYIGSFVTVLEMKWCLFCCVSIFSKVSVNFYTREGGGVD